MLLWCPHCHEKLEGPDHLAGKIRCCPACRQPIRIPGPAERMADELHRLVGDRREAQRRRRLKQFGAGVAIGGLLLAPVVECIVPSATASVITVSLLLGLVIFLMGRMQE